LAGIPTIPHPLRNQAHIKDIPAAIIAHFGLDHIAENGFVYCDFYQGMYGLPQAGILAKDYLVIHLEKYG
jgi:hypothetical protein